MGGKIFVYNMEGNRELCIGLFLVYYLLQLGSRL